jgi:hypothetical protein
MDPQPLCGGDYGAPGGVANATEFVAHIFPVPAGRTFREAQIRLWQDAVFHPLIPGLRGDAEFTGAGRPVDEFRHSVAWAQIVLAYSHAARPPAELQGNPLAVIKPTGANATASRSVASGLTSSPSWYGVTHYADHRHQRASVVLSRRFGLSEVNQRCEVKAALGDGVEFLGDSL